MEQADFFQKQISKQFFGVGEKKEAWAAVAYVLRWLALFYALRTEAPLSLTLPPKVMERRKYLQSDITFQFTRKWSFGDKCK